MSFVISLIAPDSLAYDLMGAAFFSAQLIDYMYFLFKENVLLTFGRKRFHDYDGLSV